MKRELNLDCVNRLGRFAAYFLIGATLAGSSAFAKKTARVLVDSYAREGYEEAKVVDGESRHETYHFFKGRHFGGNMRDPSLRELSFEDMAVALAEEMKARNYYSVMGQEEGDFLIVVHWGVTGIEESLDELMMNDVGGFGSVDSGTVVDSSSGEIGSDFSQDYFNNVESYDSTGSGRADQNNASLIGFDRALSRKGLSSQDDYELRSMLRDERYFIVLMAYDWQKMRLEQKFDLVWSTRFSLDAIGTNFRDAHFALSRGAANYIGTNLDGDLGKTKTHLGTGDVELGDIEVVETIKETSSKK